MAELMNIIDWQPIIIIWSGHKYVEMHSCRLYILPLWGIYSTRQTRGRRTVSAGLRFNKHLLIHNHYQSRELKQVGLSKVVITWLFSYCKRDTAPRLGSQIYNTALGCASCCIELLNPTPRAVLRSVSTTIYIFRHHFLKAIDFVASKFSAKSTSKIIASIIYIYIYV